MIGVLSDPYIVSPTVPDHAEPEEMVNTPPIAEVKYEVLKVALPVITPILCDEPRKVVLPFTVPLLAVDSSNVALPVIYVVFVLVPVNITPATPAEPVSPVELINNGSVVVDELMIGEVVPTIYASIVLFGTAFVGTEHVSFVYQFPTVLQSESAIPHHT